MNGCCVNDKIDVIGDIFSTLTDRDMGTFGFKVMGKFAGFLVGTGDCKVSGEQNLCQRAHADAANADKVNMYR